MILPFSPVREWRSPVVLRWSRWFSVEQADKKTNWSHLPMAFFSAGFWIKQWSKSLWRQLRQRHICTTRWGSLQWMCIQATLQQWQTSQSFPEVTSGWVRFDAFKMVMRLVLFTLHSAWTGTSLTSLIISQCNTLKVTSQIVQMCFLTVDLWLFVSAVQPSKQPWSKKDRMPLKNMARKNDFPMALSLWIQWLVCYSHWSSWSLFLNLWAPV